MPLCNKPNSTNVQEYDYEVDGVCGDDHVMPCNWDQEDHQEALWYMDMMDYYDITMIIIEPFSEEGMHFIMIYSTISTYISS